MLDPLRCYAHSRPDGSESSWEPLEDHLAAVALRAAEFGSAFGSADWAALAGRWHDLGKFRPEFQQRLRGSREQVEHAGVGAALADARGLVPAAFVIAGHHAGLANFRVQGDSRQLALEERIRANREVLRRILPLIPAEIRDLSSPSPPPHLAESSTDRDGAKRGWEFWIRMLFSALVDADYLATEAFYTPGRVAQREPGSPLADLRRRLDERLARFAPTTEVNRLRARVLADCRAAAAEPPGVFTLSVPTGGGKTLSSMAFALEHVERHGLRRIVMAVPYTTIIEQNASVLREALGKSDVLEHHSNLDEAELLEQFGEVEVRRRLAAENWDARVVVTTNVQLFESLFSNRPSQCRKLHNLARSVVILDEAQVLPVGFLLPVLDAIRTLSQDYGCTFVLSTATQPALLHRERLPQGLRGVREIVRDPDGLARALRRVRVTWPEADETTTYEEVAQELARERRVLTIVHRRRDARDLAGLLPEEGRFHLSALMCAAHRTEVLERIRAVLRDSGTCRLVATQLIEAGVDIDFPVVYRALGGLDSVAQAAGRCNREGELRDGEGRPVPGRLRLFRAPTLPPVGVLRRGLEAAESMLVRYGSGVDIGDPEIMEEYFRILYAGSNLDQRGIQPERLALNFATVADHFQLIEDGYTRPVVVPWGDGADRVRAFAERPDRTTQRGLQPYLVQVPERELANLSLLGAVELLHDRVHALSPPYLSLYDPVYGLIIGDDTAPDPEALIA